MNDSVDELLKLIGSMSDLMSVNSPSRVIELWETADQRDLTGDEWHELATLTAGAREPERIKKLVAKILSVL